MSVEREVIKERVREAAFHEESTGRRIVHCMAGSFGADWDLDEVLAEIDKAKTVSWASNVFRHELAVVNPEGRIHRFDLQAPEGVLA